MEYADLKGKKVDMIGFGTYKIGNGEVEKAVETALETGYKRIDTAVMYANEKGIGRAINKSGVKREDLFITTKLWTDVKTPEDVRKSVYGSLERLKTDYIDMLLIHWPTEYKNEVWRGMERMKKDGVVKGIGLSNFKIHHIEELEKEAEFYPEWNQLEIHPYFQNTETVEYCRKKGIVCEAWSPLARGAALNDETIKKIALKYQKSAAQIILRYDIQNNVSAVPKSTHAERIKENIDIFDFSLTASDVEEIKKLETNKRLYRDPDNHGF